jgi:hypothetical protein
MGFRVGLGSLFLVVGILGAGERFKHCRKHNLKTRNIS